MYVMSLSCVCDDLNNITLYHAVQALKYWTLDSPVGLSEVKLAVRALNPIDEVDIFNRTVEYIFNGSPDETDAGFYMKETAVDGQVSF